MTAENMEQRVTALELRAAAVDQKAATDARLADGVERLSGETNSLNAILNKVDEQQQRLGRLDRRVEEVDQGKASKGEVVDGLQEARRERAKNLRKMYLTAGGALLIALSGVIGGAWLTDTHIQNCLLHGPNTEAERDVCNTTFPGHDHPTELSLDALLKRGAANQVKAVMASRRGCERTQARVQIEIDKEDNLAVTDFEPARPAHTKAAAALRKTLINCDEEYPLPATSPEEGHR